MKFALNWSPQAQALLDDGTLDIDLWKCPDWDDLLDSARRTRPAYVHFPLMAGRGNALAFERVEDLLARSDTLYVNTHLAPDARLYRYPRDANAMVAHMVSDVRRLTARFGAERVIVENAPYPDPPYGIETVSAAMIAEVVEMTGAGLLLDLAHAALTAQHSGVPVRAYVGSLPLRHLRELHVTGLGIDPNGLLTDHLPMRREDWALFDWALDEIAAGRWRAPEVVACEYGGIGPLFAWRSDAAVIAADVPRMAARVKSA